MFWEFTRSVIKFLNVSWTLKTVWVDDNGDMISCCPKQGAGNSPERCWKAFIVMLFCRYGRSGIRRPHLPYMWPRLQVFIRHTAGRHQQGVWAGELQWRWTTWNEELWWRQHRSKVLQLCRMWEDVCWKRQFLSPQKHTFRAKTVCMWHLWESL